MVQEKDEAAGPMMTNQTAADFRAATMIGTMCLPLQIKRCLQVQRHHHKPAHCYWETMMAGAKPNRLAKLVHFRPS